MKINFFIIFSKKISETELLQRKRVAKRNYITLLRKVLKLNVEFIKKAYIF